MNLHVCNLSTPKDILNNYIHIGAYRTLFPAHGQTKPRCIMLVTEIHVRNNCYIIESLSTKDILYLTLTGAYKWSGDKADISPNIIDKLQELRNKRI